MKFRKQPLLLSPIEPEGDPHGGQSLRSSDRTQLLSEDELKCLQQWTESHRELSEPNDSQPSE